MADMNKLKEDALRRKQEFEDKKRSEEFRKQRDRSNRSSHKKRDRDASGRGRKGQAKPAMQVRKKAKKTPMRWVVDILLVLGTLLVLIMLFNPY